MPSHLLLPHHGPNRPTPQSPGSRRLRISPIGPSFRNHTTKHILGNQQRPHMLDRKVHTAVQLQGAVNLDGNTEWLSLCYLGPATAVWSWRRGSVCDWDVWVGLNSHIRWHRTTLWENNLTEPGSMVLEVIGVLFPIFSDWSCDSSRRTFLIRDWLLMQGDFVSISDNVSWNYRCQTQYWGGISRLQCHRIVSSRDSRHLDGFVISCKHLRKIELSSAIVYLSDADSGKRFLSLRQFLRLTLTSNGRNPAIDSSYGI